MPKSLIALTGVAGSGKSTVAKYLCSEHNFTRIRFAGPLKDMLIAIGLTSDHVDGALKNHPEELLLGKTPRYAMQTLGTEWGRNLIGHKFWINLWKHQVETALDENKKIVVDDLRFFNEAYAVRELNGFVYRIQRPAFASSDEHQSETELNKIIVDGTIINDSDISTLHALLDKVLEL